MVQGAVGLVALWLEDIRQLKGFPVNLGGCPSAFTGSQVDVEDDLPAGEAAEVYQQDVEDDVKEARKFNSTFSDTKE